MMRYGGNGFVQSGVACANALPAKTSVRSNERKIVFMMDSPTSYESGFPTRASLLQRRWMKSTSSITVGLRIIWVLDKKAARPKIGRPLQRQLPLQIADSCVTPIHGNDRFLVTSPVA